MPANAFASLKNIRPMTARNTDQAHRVSTPLELLFDLVTVIAIASAAAGLHHAIAAGPVAGAAGAVVPLLGALRLV